MLNDIDDDDGDRDRDREGIWRFVSGVLVLVLQRKWAVVVVGIGSVWFNAILIW